MAALIDEAFADFPRPLEPLAIDAAVARMADLLEQRSDGYRRRPGDRHGSTAQSIKRASSWPLKLIARLPRRSWSA